MRNLGRLIIISAPSGAGKTTVIHRFLAKNPNRVHSISCTTRPKRPNEIDGKDYHFISLTTFKEGITGNQFAEWAHVHDHYYGTPKEILESWLREGREVLLDVDVVGGTHLKKIYRDQAVSIFLLPPNHEELQRRLFNRGTDSEEQKEIRIRNALKELTYKDQYDYQVVNDVLEKACSDIEEVLDAHARRL